MGCHTWFHKKIKGPSDEEVKTKIVEKIDKELDFLERIVIDRNSIDPDLLEAYPEWTPEYSEQQKPYWVNLKSQIINGEMSINEMRDLYSDMTYEITYYVDGRGWFVSSGELPHDLFRKYGYPDDRLFSLEETLDYINNPENKCVVYEETIEDLKKFWSEHPEGMINFG